MFREPSKKRAGWVCAEGSRESPSREKALSRETAERLQNQPLKHEPGKSV
jgi:hypothetical protein